LPPEKNTEKLSIPFVDVTSLKAAQREETTKQGKPL
jgi:hypothetical protein